MTLCSALFFAAVSGAAAQAAPASVYTRHHYSACPTATSPEPGVVEVRVCGGPGGVAVTMTADPDSAALTFGRSPMTEDLAIGPFFEPGETIEWRGDGAPVAAIVRYRVGRSVGALTESRLVVYRLEASGRSCVMAVLREPNANQRARDVVDRAAGRFRCGAKRLVG